MLLPFMRDWRADPNGYAVMASDQGTWVGFRRRSAILGDMFHDSFQ